MNFIETISVNLVILAMLISLMPTVASIAAVFIHIRAQAKMNAKLDHISKQTNSTLDIAHERIEQLEAIVLKLTKET